MKSKVLLAVTLGLIFIAVFIVVFFDISLTSLPTTFNEFVEERINQDEALVMEGLDL